MSYRLLFKFQKFSLFTRLTIFLAFCFDVISSRKGKTNSKGSRKFMSSIGWQQEVGASFPHRDFSASVVMIVTIEHAGINFFATMCSVFSRKFSHSSAVRHKKPESNDIICSFLKNYKLTRLFQESLLISRDSLDVCRYLI